jgi:hypothetical protein
MCEEHFVESYRATGSSDMGFCRADQRDRITLVDQHAATDRQIAGSGSGKLAGVSLDELDFGVAGGTRSRAATTAVGLRSMAMTVPVGPTIRRRGLYL